MKVAEVWVNVDNLPTKEVLINQALKTAKYLYYPKDKAIELINKEIKASGLFKASTKRVSKPSSDASRPSGLSNARKRSLDKKKDKR